MRRAGGWILGLGTVAAMAGGAWIAFRPILNRETLYVSVNRGGRDPSTDAMISGMEFALAESGGRGGPFRVELTDPRGRTPGDPSMTIDLGDVILIQARPSYPPTEDPTPLQVLKDPEELGRAAIAWARQSGSTRTVLLWDEATHQSWSIAESFKEGGPPLVATVDLRPEGPDASANVNLDALMDKALAEKPDLVFYTGDPAPYGTAFALFEALRRKGYAGRLALADSDPEVSLLGVPTRIVEGMLLLSPIGPPSKEFTAAYESATGRHAGPHAWPGYLTMSAILRIFEQTSAGSPGAVLAAFKAVPVQRCPGAVYAYRNGRFEFIQNLK